MSSAINIRWNSHTVILSLLLDSVGTKSPEFFQVCSRGGVENRPRLELHTQVEA